MVNKSIITTIVTAGALAAMASSLAACGGHSGSTARDATVTSTRCLTTATGMQVCTGYNAEGQAVQEQRCLTNATGGQFCSTTELGK